jgi:hypothetical protein
MSEAKQTIRRYFFDTEFNENRPVTGKRLFDIDFISIGIVSEDGEYYYAENKDCDVEEASRHDWLKAHVVDKLGPEALRKDISEIRDDLYKFIRPAQTVEFYARNYAYDAVTLCRIFGSMQQMKTDLSQKGVLRFMFRDINEFKFDEQVNWNRLPRKEEDKEHHAGYDAKFERELYRHIMQLKKG